MVALVVKKNLENVSDLEIRANKTFLQMKYVHIMIAYQNQTHICDGGKYIKKQNANNNTTQKKKKGSIINKLVPHFLSTIHHKEKKFTE